MQDILLYILQKKQREQGIGYIIFALLNPLKATVKRYIIIYIICLYDYRETIIYKIWLISINFSPLKCK